jgi:hypothetical protein
MIPMRMMNDGQRMLASIGEMIPKFARRNVAPKRMMRHKEYRHKQLETCIWRSIKILPLFR